MKILNNKVGLLTYIVSFVVVFFVVKYGIEYFSNNIEDILKSKAIEISKTLPQVGQSGIKFVDVKAKGKTFQYFYQQPLNYDELDKSLLKKYEKDITNLLIERACKAAEMRSDMERGIVFEYQYSSKDNVVLFKFPISEKSC